MASQSNGHEDLASTTRGRADAHAAALADLRRLERLFADCEWPDRRVFVRARKRTREHALQMLESGRSSADATATALLITAAELFVAMRVELAPRGQVAAHLVEQLENIFGVSKIALAREVLRAPDLLTIAPTTALELQLTMLTAFAPLRSVSLWMRDDAEQLKCVSHAGENAPSTGARQLARRLLARERIEEGPRRLLLALPVGSRPAQPLAGLIGSARPGTREACHSVLAEAVPMLGAILERDALLAGNAASERALVQSSERKLTRLGFDLHDGPIQEVAMLAEDVRLLEGQLEALVKTSRQRELVRGRMEDLNAQLASLEAELAGWPAKCMPPSS